MGHLDIPTNLLLGRMEPPIIRKRRRKDLQQPTVDPGNPQGVLSPEGTVCPTETMEIKGGQTIQVAEDLADADTVLDNEVVDLLVLDQDLGFGIAEDLVVAEQADLALEPGQDLGSVLGLEGDLFVFDNRHRHDLIEVCADESLEVSVGGQEDAFKAREPVGKTEGRVPLGHDIAKMTRDLDNGGTRSAFEHGGKRH